MNSKVVCLVLLAASAVGCSDPSADNGAAVTGTPTAPATIAPPPATTGEGMPSASAPGAVPTLPPQPGGGDIIVGGEEEFAPPPCVGLLCQQVACEAGVTTRVSGTVYDPSGTLPLYNVMVYVPNAELEPLTDGASCDRCETSASGDPIVSALSGTDGRFVLENVPAGTNIPLVIQVGKWRRQVVIPEVLPCADNALTDVNQTRLPGSRAEGDMPRIAMVTGELDALECLLRKLGIADTEFTPTVDGGRISLFAGHGGGEVYSSTLNAGAAVAPAQELWDDPAALMQFDALLMACEGGEYPQEKSEEARQNMFDYANAGGRIFMSHWHKIWLQRGPDPFPDVVNFVNSDTDLTLTASVDTTFPKGQALAEWLVNVQGSTTLGTVDLVDAQDTAESENPELAQRWIYTTEDPTTVQYVSANTPIGSDSDEQCGRIVYSNLHVTTGNAELGGAVDTPGAAFPEGCVTTGLTAQEKVLAFMLFDLSACIIPDDVPPQPPRAAR